MLGLGIVPLDLLFQVERMPKAGEKVDALQSCVQGGGPVPNTLVGLSRLGFSTAVIVAVGDDLFGRISLEELRREKVDVSLARIKGKASAAAIGFIEQGSGRRTIALHRPVGLTAGDVKLSELPLPRLVHIDGRDMDACLKLARWAHRKGVIVSFDIGSVRNDVSALLPLVDQLVVADVFAFAYTGKRTARKAVEALQKICPGTVVVTEGIDGSVGHENGVWAQARAYKVKSVDTTGAGDSFHAGYIYGLLNGFDLLTRLEFGSATAALKCTGMGARTSAPTLTQVRRFVASRPKRYA